MRWCSRRPDCGGSGSRRASRCALPAAACVPAPGQGIVAIEIRAGRRRGRARAVARIDDAGGRAALDAERALVDALGGGCQTPIGALASPVDGGELELVAAVVVRSTAAARFAAHGARHRGDEAAALGAARRRAAARATAPARFSRDADQAQRDVEPARDGRHEP